MKRVEADPHDAAALTLIGEIFAEGVAVPLNLNEALKWDKLAAEQGDKNAQYALANAYLSGKGEPKDVAAARSLVRKGRRAGSCRRLVQSRRLRARGQWRRLEFQAGGAEDFRRSADLGFPDAAYALALLYREGKGVPKDHGQAAQWLKRAAEENYLAAEVEYGIALFNGDGMPADEPGGAKWLLRAANRNNAIAQDRVARMFFAGRGLKQDRVEGAKWAILAAAAGLHDNWLDNQANQLTPDERKKTEQAIKIFLGR